MPLISTADAATKLKVSRSRVLAMIRDGRLRAQKIGRDWLIEESDLQSPMVADRKPGRPRRKK
jgi:excisionase family DNA binding protein